MLTRILTGVVAFLIFLPFLIFSDTIAFPIAMAVCAVISTYEMIRCTGLGKKHHITIPLCLCAAAIPLCMRLNVIGTFIIAPVVCLVLMLYILAVTIFSHGKVTIPHAMTALGVSLYIIAAFACMVFMRDIPAISGYGEYMYLLVFIGAWVPDTFAYFTGRLFGKHKLIPDVSPKKTVEGAIGGTVFCVLAFVIFAVVCNEFFGCKCDEPCDHALSIPLMALLGLLAAVVSMIGDLSMSVIKRHFGVKDYGRILPGHGGFLDRFDSVLAVAVILAVSFGVLTLVRLYS